MYIKRILLLTLCFGLLVLSNAPVQAQTTDVTTETPELVTIKFSGDQTVVKAHDLSTTVGGKIISLRHDYVIGNEIHSGEIFVRENDTAQTIHSRLLEYHTDFITNILSEAENTRQESETMTVATTNDLQAYAAAMPTSIQITSMQVQATKSQLVNIFANTEVVMVEYENGERVTGNLEHQLFLPISQRPNSSVTAQEVNVEHWETWAPEEGYVLVQPHHNFQGQRYILNEFWWDDASALHAYPYNNTYEHDFFLNASDGSDRGPGTYLTRAQYSNGIPGIEYWASNLPYAYLDTRLEDPAFQVAYTIGSGGAGPIYVYTWYYTYILARNGDANVDTAMLKGQIGHQNPWGCTSVWCSYGNASEFLYGYGWSFDVPNYIWWRK